LTIFAKETKQIGDRDAHQIPQKNEANVAETTSQNLHATLTDCPNDV